MVFARVWLLLSSCSLVLAELQRAFGCLLVPFQKLRFGRGGGCALLLFGCLSLLHKPFPDASSFRLC